MWAKRSPVRVYTQVGSILASNIRLGRKWLAFTNALAYYTVIKIFIEYARDKIFE
jgi:hypothetical protein